MVSQATVWFDAASPRIVVLTIDDTTAHITVSASWAEELRAWFQRANIGCTRRRGAGVTGLDVIDFGNPSPAEEQRIRAAFAAWRSRDS